MNGDPRCFHGGSVVKNTLAMQETWVQFLGWEDPLGKEMVAHSSTLAWRILWTEEPCDLQTMGLQKSQTRLNDQTTTAIQETPGQYQDGDSRCSQKRSLHHKNVLTYIEMEEINLERTERERRQHSIIYFKYCIPMGFPGGSVVKNPPANAGDKGSIPGSGRSPGGGNGNSLQDSCLGNPMGRGAWQATVHSVAKSQT